MIQGGGFRLKTPLYSPFSKKGEGRISYPAKCWPRNPVTRATYSDESVRYA